MKIKNFDKINGFTYKGYCIVNPIHNADETKYSADVLDLNTPQKTKWELSLLMPGFKFKPDNNITIILWDDDRYSTTKSISKDTISTTAGFRMVFENLVDELLKHRLTSAPIYSSHSINTAYTKPINPNYYGTVNVTSGQGGILNTITANSNTIAWAPSRISSTSTNLPNEMLIAIKDLQEQIDKLKQQQNEI